MVNNMDNNEGYIQGVHRVQIETIRELDRVCRKHGISYWMYAGSLLGTIRHHGFIPWDDDIDVGMMREDYDRLLQVPVSEWNEGFFLCDALNPDERHDMLFGRLYADKTKVQSKKDVENWKRWSDNQSWSTSLMCDVFIFDHIPNDRKEYLKIRRKSMRQKQLYRIMKLKPCISKGSAKQRIKGISRRLLSGVSRAFFDEPWTIIVSRNRRMIQQSSKGNNVSSYYAGHSKAGVSFPEEYLFPLKEAEFEGIKVFIPNQWDYLLKAMYGNYMTPPPTFERVHIDMTLLDLGDGTEHIIDESVLDSLGD